ncbi:hypothetical protein AND_004182 [Anopheles darlingi]|uniref:Uncharacterized protein n=1 Tax=Anopheles darlingi TaxID=43151 RepID=W5JMT2_ANODA|nr:hypothetical protein AND_004182 [Anopheles darlingi]
MAEYASGGGSSRDHFGRSKIGSSIDARGKMLPRDGITMDVQDATVFRDETIWPSHRNPKPPEGGTIASMRWSALTKRSRSLVLGAPLEPDFNAAFRESALIGLQPCNVVLALRLENRCKKENGKIAKYRLTCAGSRRRRCAWRGKTQTLPEWHAVAHLPLFHAVVLGGRFVVNPRDFADVLLPVRPVDDIETFSTLIVCPASTRKSMSHR